MRFAIIGEQGHFGSAISAAKADPSLELCAVAPGVQGESMAKAAGAAKRQLDIDIKQYDDWRIMVDEQKPDICVVNTEFHMDGPISAQLLLMGISVFAEKPAGTTLEQLEEVSAAYNASGAKYLSMLTYYYDPAFYKAFCLIRDGSIGKPRLITAQKSYKLGQRAPFYSDKLKYGGTISWVGIHAATWAHQMGLGAKFQTVSALSDNQFNKGNGDLDMTSIMRFQMEGGLLFSASADFLRPEYAPSHGDDRVRVAGTDGIVEVIGEKVMVMSPGFSGEVEIDVPKANIFADFAATVSGKGTARFTAEDSFQISRAVLCAQSSADCGRVVTITG